MTSPVRPDVEPSGIDSGDHTFEIQHDGRTRRYYVHVPEKLAAASPSAMLALHGGGGSARQFKDEISLDAVADREGFIAVYPDGVGPGTRLLHTWNSGHNCCGQAQRSNVDDVGFVLAVLDDLATKISYDEERVSVIGHSNGAMMAYRLAAEASHRFSAVIPVAGAMALDDFAPGNPVAVLHIHSIDDPRALYEGGEGPPFPGTNSTVVHEPALEAIRAWADVNGCSGELAETRVIHESEIQKVAVLDFDACGGAIVQHVIITGAGHGWPGVSYNRFRERTTGPSITSVDAVELAWAFARDVADG